MSQPTPESTAPAKRGLGRWLPLLAIAAGAAAVFAFGLDDYLSFEVLEANRTWLQDWVAANALAAALVFMAVYAAATAFSVPGGAFLSILGGFLFGTWLGAVYIVAGASVGAVAVFLAARTALGDLLRERAGGAVQRMRAGFQDNALSYMLFLRLIPIFPFWLVNLVPAFLGVRLGTYTLGTVLGIAPGAAVYASVGNGVDTILAAGERPDLGIIFEPSILGPIVGLAVLSLLPVAHKHYRARRG